MKLKTSCSKLTPFKKDITRFAPVWVLYLIGLLLVMVRQMGAYDAGTKAHNLPGIISTFGIVNLIYAGVCAQLLFGDLYNTRMCYSLHALPQRRESWLLNHLGAGFAFSLVPNLIAALFLMLQMGELGFLMLYTLLAMELQFLFYFGLATVSALVTGNRFAMVLVYAGLNFVSVLAYWILETIYLPMLPGVVLDMEPYQLLCPTVQLFNYDFMEFKRVEIEQDIGYRDWTYEFVGLADGWGYTAVLGILGLVLMGLSALLYRLRHLESAGDFLAFPKLKPPMCVAITVCMGGVCALIGEFIIGDSMLLWLIVGIVVGYFGGLMLLERRIKVFRVKSLIGFAVLAAVLICSYVLTYLDAFGVVAWVPKADQVQSVTVSNYNDSGYNGGWYSGNRISVTLEEQEQIEEILVAHEDIIDRLENSKNSTHRVVITYRLESGRTVKRSYSAPANGKNYEIITKYFNTPEQVLGYTDWDRFVEELEQLDTSGNPIPETHWAEVMEALRKDCQAGHVTLSGGKGEETEFYLFLRSGSVIRDLAVDSGAEHLKAVLSKPEVILGYTDWEDLLQKMTNVAVDGEQVPREQLRALMEAVKADCESGAISLYQEQTAVTYLSYNVGYEYRFLNIPYGAKETMACIKENLPQINNEPVNK